MIGFPNEPTRHCRFCEVEIDSESKYYYKRICEDEGCITLESMDVDRERDPWAEVTYSVHSMANAVDVFSASITKTIAHIEENKLFGHRCPSNHMHVDFDFGKKRRGK